MLEPSCIEDWLRVTRKGGLIGFNVDYYHWDIWEAENRRLEEAHRWKMEYQKNFPICTSILSPDNSMDGLMGKIYIFRKL